MNERIYNFGSQQTEEWHKLKLGIFSSSDIYKLFVDPKTKKSKEAGEFSSTSWKYIKEKACEVIYQEREITPTTKAMDWGNENESLARQFFIENSLQFPDEEKISFLQFGNYTGTSPDDTINKKIPSEYKNPFNRLIHLDHLDIKTEEDLYKYSKQKFYQIHHQIYCLGAEFGFWSSFDRRLLLNEETKHLAIHTIKIQRNQELCEEFERRISKAGESRDLYIQSKMGIHEISRR